MASFKNFKEDFTKAVNQLIPEDNDESTAKDYMVDTLDDKKKYNMVQDTVQDKDSGTKEGTGYDGVEEKSEGFMEGNEVDMEENVDLELLDALNANTSEENVSAASVGDESETTIICKGTTINGDISTDGSLEIMGSITGDVECQGRLSISGKVIGNCTANEVYLSTERQEGSVKSESSIKVGLGTVVVGDIVGTSAVIEGAVKGEIDIKGPIIIDSTAVIKGNIKAKSIQINNGAVIEGFCSLSNSDIEIDNVFE